MGPQQLKHFVELPDTHRRLLAHYDGPYSLGIGRSEGDFVLVLTVEADAPSVFPNEIRLNGETVPVVVEHTFIAPVPLTTQG